MNLDQITKIINRNQIMIAILTAILIVVASLSIYFFVYKTHGFLITRYDEVLIARNWAQTGFLGYEDANNAVIMSSTLKTEGVPTTLGNKLTYYIYGIIFRTVGFRPSLPMYISFLLYAISASLLFLLIKKLFGWPIGLLAAAINLVAPFFLPYILSVGKSEWAYFFFIIATLIYFWPANYKKIWRLILVGAFLGLSVASRNSYFVTILPIAIVELWFARDVFKKRFVNTAILSTTFLLIVVPFAFKGANSYFGLAFGGQKFESFHILGHIFPDPYTYKTERDQYINDLIARNQHASLKQKFGFWGDSGMFLGTFGSVRIGFLHRQIIPIIFSFVFYAESFLSLIVFGGGLIWFLILFGAKIVAVENKNRDFLLFSFVSLVAWYVALSVTRTSNYPHFIMLVLPLTVLSAAGLLNLARYITSHFNFSNLHRRLVIVLVVGAVLLPMFETSWWHLRDYYQNSTAEAAGEAFVRAHKAGDFPKNGVIVVGFFPKAPVLFNYYFDRNFIYFHPDTIKSLITQGKLKSVLQHYKISGFLGYDEDITSLINQQTHNQLKKY